MAENLGKKKLLSYYRSVFGSKEGKLVLADLMLTHFYNSTTMAPGMSDVTFFNEGQREVVRRILLLTKVDPEELLKQAVEKEANHV